MPKKRKREAPKDKEEPESPLAPEEPEEALGSSPTSSTSPPTALATRAPVLAKLEESYEAAKLEIINVAINHCTQIVQVRNAQLSEQFGLHL